MATQQETQKRLDEAATNAEFATKAWGDVLTSEGEQDILLQDGTTTPNLNKRLSGIAQAVKSVNGRTGNVVVTREDLGLQSDELMARQLKEDRFVITEDGRTQRVVNKQIIRNIATKDLLSEQQSTDVVHILENQGVYIVDPTSTSNGNGYSTILDGKNRRWVLQNKERYAEYFDKGKFPRTYASAYRMGLGRQDYGPFEIAMRQQLIGSGYGTQLYQSPVTTTDNEAQLRDFRYYESVDSSLYAIRDRVNDNGVQPYYSEYSNIHTTGCNGMEICGVEPLIKNVRIGSNSRADRIDFGIRATKKTSGDAFTSIDLSLANVYTQGAKTGFSVRGAYHFVDGHFVWSDTGMRIEGSNLDTSMPDQKVSFGLYLDKAYRNGMYLYGASHTSTYSPHFYESGLYQDDATVEVSGLRFEQVCNNNFVSAPSFNTQNLSKVTTLIWIDPQAKNNTILHPMGSYKLRDLDAKRMRDQTVISGTGNWARHNNVMRQMRSNSGSVAVGAEVTLTFLSDYAFPSFQGTNNFVLFKGHYASRGVDGSTAYGEIYLVSSDNTTDYGANNTMRVISGSSNTKWEIVNFTRSRAELSLTLKNVSASASQIGIELQRSVDAKGFTF